MASPYAGGGSSGGSVYAKPGSTSGSPYAGGGGGAPASKGRGGILGAIEGGAHWVASKSDLAARDIKAIPGGVVQVGKLLGQGTAAALTGNQKALNKNAKQITALGKAQVASAKTAVEHPARDPFQTVTTLLPLLHGAGIGAARLGAAADVAKTGGTFTDSLKAAAAKPEIAPRLLTVGDKQANLHPSKTVTGRGAQGVYDKVLQHSLDTNPEGKIAAHANRRVGGSIAETARYQQRMQAAPAEALDQAGRKAPKIDKVPPKLAQAALRLTSENSTPAEAAQFHLGQVEKGIAVKENASQARLYQAVDKLELTTKDAKGNVAINSEKYPALAGVDKQVEAGQSQVDKIAEDHGLRTRDQLQERISGPAKIRAGADYVAPTPGRLGKPSQGLVGMRGYVNRLQILHDNATQRLQKLNFTAADKKRIGPDLQAPTDASVELRQRLAPMEKELRGLTVAHNAPANGLLEERAALNRLLRLGTDASKAVDAFASKAGTEGGVAGLDELKAQADAMTERINATRGIPSNEMKALRQSVAAIRRSLQTAEAPRSYLMSGDRPYVVTAKGEIIRPIGHARAEQLGGALSIAKERLAQKEASAAKRVEPTGVVGGETARPGRGFVSYKTKTPKAPKTSVASSGGPVVGVAKPFISSHAITYDALKQGLVPDNTTRLVAQHMRDAYRYVNTDQFRRNALQTGADVRRSSRDVLVRNPDVKAGEIPAEIDQALGRKTITTDELGGHEQAFQDYMEQLIPGLHDRFAADKAQAIGAKAPTGYRWVDKGILGDLAKPVFGQRGRIARTADNINSAVTAATVYFKVGHVGTRVLTNAATNIIQGSAKPLDIARSVDLWKQIGREDKIRALAAAGQHGFASMPHEGESLASKVAGKGANWWAKHADAPFRFNSIAYEARKAGFNTPEKFTKMLDDLEHPENLTPAEAAKVDAVAKNANREGIAYDRLNNAERQFLTRGIWFYPWVKGASVFAGRTLFEHPFKSALLGAAGVQGRKTQQAELGDVPSYEAGLFKVGGGDPFGRPLVADFSTFSPFSTPADLLETVARPAGAAGQLNPVYSAVNSLANGLTPYGTKSTSPIKDALTTLFSPMPETQIGTAFANRGKDQSKKMFPADPRLWGTLSPILRALLGPGTPRRYNPAAGASSAKRERTGR